MPYPGTKQTICLTDEQIAELDDILGEYQILSFAETEMLKKKYGIAWSTIKRRANVSKYIVYSGYTWEEYKDLVKIVTKRLLFFNCEMCNSYTKHLVHQFRSRKQKDKKVCKVCYSKNYVFTDEWRHTNSQAQLIAQNRPEVIAKHRKNSKAMWTRPKVRNAITSAIKERMSHKEARDNLSTKMKVVWNDKDFRDRVNGKGNYRNTGSIGGLTYGSKLELAFIIWQKSLGIDVEDYNIDGIEYIFDDRKHNYYPDFIIGNNIIEIKGLYWFERHKDTVLSKVRAAISFCQKNNMKYKFILDHKIPKEFIQEAIELHNEIKIKKN